MKNEMMEEITEKIDEIVSRRERVLNLFFDILFWRNSSAGYVNLDDKYAIVGLMDTAKIEGPEGETWIDGDRVKMLEVANRIREKIGLPTLRNERYGLAEVPANEKHVDAEFLDFCRLSNKEKWSKAKTLKNVVWCCAECGETVDNGKLPEKEFMGEICCGNCDATLTRRTGGGQNDPFNWIPKRKEAKK